MTNTTKNIFKEHISHTLEKALRIDHRLPLKHLLLQGNFSVGIGILARTADVLRISYLVDPLVYQMVPARKYTFRQIHKHRGNHLEDTLAVTSQEGKDRFTVNFFYKETLPPSSVYLSWDTGNSPYTPSYFFIHKDEEVLPLNENQREYLILACASLNYNEARLAEEAQRIVPQSPPPQEKAPIQPKKETVRLNLPPRPTSIPTIRLPREVKP